LERITAPGNTSGISQIHSPAARIPLTVIDTLARFLPVVNRLEPLIPGTAGHHNMLVNGLQGRVAQEEKNATEEARQRNLDSEAEERGNRSAATPKPMAVKAGEGIYDPATKTWLIEPKSEEEATEITPEIGQHLGLVPTREGKYMLPKGGASLLKPEKTETPKTAAELWISQHPQGTAEELQEALAKAPKEAAAKTFSAEDAALIRAVGGDPDKPETLTLPILKKYIASKQLPERPERPPHALIYDPNTKKFMEAGPGTTAPEGFTTATQAGTANAPTTQMRNAASRAELVHEQMPATISEITRLKDKLGPFAGRWNDFMQGKVGGNDPQFSGLRADMLMMSSAVALAHAQGRLPENLREEFDRTINAPNQTADNLISTLQHIDAWMVKNKEVMRGGPAPAAGGGENAPMTVKLPSGRTIEIK
jgi:hypothetical protein